MLVLLEAFRVLGHPRKALQAWLATIVTTAWLAIFVYVEWTHPKISIVWFLAMVAGLFIVVEAVVRVPRWLSTEVKAPGRDDLR
jgi:hypothetical protein